MISGDGFRAMCDRVWDELSDVGFTAEVANTNVWFCKPDYVSELVRQIRDTPNMASKCSAMTLVVHNGDHAVEKAEFTFLSKTFRCVFAVNVADRMRKAAEPGRLVAIPIGIENAHWNRAGSPSHFPQIGHFGELTAWAQRPIDVFACFNPATNAAEREPLRKEILIQLPRAWREPTLSQSEFASQLRQSKFVVSPPGNGSDCHRTWEALYLGAIPVILRDTLDSSLVDGLPIWAVDDWDEFLSITQSERNRIGLKLLERERGMLDLGYWYSKIRIEPMQFQ
ncbi:MAG: hypothetical protein WCK17_15770 [Verrucomicrobiota bacterium]